MTGPNTTPTSGVDSNQRFSKANPCPVCGGHSGLSQGSGQRCYGFLSGDGEYAHCTREECAGDLEENPKTQAYAHRMEGSCKCGVSHGDASPRPRGRSGD